MPEEDRRAYSQQRLQELDKRLEPVRELLANHRLCVYATGSYGRLEAWQKSDIDLFFLEDDADKTKRLPMTAFIQLAAHLIVVTQEMAFPEFSGDGKYLEVQYVSEMEEVLGSPRDDSLNTFTGRMLLLLEGRPIHRADVHRALLERIIGFYYRDFQDHEDTFLPTFLVNDILRFWRTLTLNYEHHRLKLRALTDEELRRKKSESALKNYKLKVSRQATCFSMVANLSAEPPPVSPGAVLELCLMAPSERFLRLRDHEGAAEIIDGLMEEYEHFLVYTQRPEEELIELLGEHEERHRVLESARNYGDLIYQLLVCVVPEQRMRSLVV
jgi:hypothetical protein